MKKITDKKWKADIDDCSEIKGYGFITHINSDDEHLPVCEVWGKTALESIQDAKLVESAPEMYRLLEILSSCNDINAKAVYEARKLLNNINK